MFKLPKVTLWILIVTLCSIGVMIQINYVSKRYFRYDTKTTVFVDIPSDIHIPSLSTCWRFNDILNISAIEHHISIKLSRWNVENFSWNEFFNQTKNFSVPD